MSKCRQLTATCPCGLSMETAGHLWLHHTTTCPAFVSKRLRTLEENVSTGTSSTLALATDQPNQEHASETDRQHDDSSSERILPVVIAARGLQLRIRRPIALRQPPPVIDIAPDGPVAPPESNQGPEEELVVPSDSSRILIWRSTPPNRFGIFRKYLVRPGQPLSIPDMTLPVAYRHQNSVIHSQLSVAEIIAPFPNTSTFRLAHWFYTGGERKSQGERQRLVRDVILAADFNPEHFRGENLEALDKAVDAIDRQAQHSQTTTTSLDLVSSDGWHTHNLTISLPLPRSSRANARLPPRSQAQSIQPDGSGLDPKSFDHFGTPVTVPGFRARSIVAVIRAHFSSLNPQATGSPLHYLPYRHYVRRTGSPIEERIYDELYTGDAWLTAHQQLQRSPPVPGCNLERVIAALMFSSDATHLTQFGQAYLWPIYLFFGNNSKLDRRRPSSRVCQHLAYIPKLSDTVKSKISALLGAKIQPALLAHCKREIFHACWRILLDNEFLDAHQNGIVVRCSDGVERRLYPRIFTYSADYPEKVLIATIKDFGHHPCPQCLIPKNMIPQLGLESDDIFRNQRRKDDDARRKSIYNARRALYELGYVANSDHVHRELKAASAVPIVNAFSDRLHHLEGFNLYRMLVPDVLHEFELGVWKSFFSHLIRMLHTLRGANAVEILNSQFRQITSFPPDTIRNFRNNVSEMRKFAARDHEDVLQCCMPCFEGLFPEEDDLNIRIIIFTFGYWHALAKLRMHTPTSLALLRTQTATLGRRLRRFATMIAPRYATTETVREAELRNRREVRQALEAGKTMGSSGGQKRRTQFSLVTYKLHALGSYASDIEQFGTSDSYSTQIGELEHRRAKSQARRTNHVNIVEDINKYDRRETHLRRRAEALSNLDNILNSTSDESNELDEPNEQEREGPEPNEVPAGAAEDVDMGFAALDDNNAHYRMSDRGKTIRIGSFLRQNANDPAITDFVPKLKDHILSRIQPSLSDFTNAQRQQLVFPTGAIVQHATVGINFTTYDIRRAQNTINPRTKHYYVMLSNNEEDPDHPFWYAKVIGIYHINVFHPLLNGGALTRVEFLWVRWLEIHTPGGWDLCRYDRVAYPNMSSSTDTFGFVNPLSVIRAVHLIPAFHYGRRERAASEPSLIGADDPELGDWNSYYVNRFVDRDTVVRYLGFGIGHVGSASNVTSLASEAAPNPNTLGSGIDMIDEERDELQQEGEGVGVLGEEGSDEETSSEREGEYESEIDEMSTAEDFEETWEEDDDL